ncbi:MAG: DUF2971 domain-containing protein [Acetobacter sp.]|nr:DUF2971 domain-containing protein [Acetobacter sp.]
MSNKSDFQNEQTETNKVNEAGMRLVHYTTAKAAYEIIQNKKIWMRQASLLNDTQEIAHGRNCLINQKKQETNYEDIQKVVETLEEERKILKKLQELESSSKPKKVQLMSHIIKDQIKDRIKDIDLQIEKPKNDLHEIEQEISEERSGYQRQYSKERIYIASFSQVSEIKKRKKKGYLDELKEFETEKKHYRGRLSMWRSYGGYNNNNVGVAIVFNTKFVEELETMSKKSEGEIACGPVEYQEVLLKDRKKHFKKEDIPFLKHPGFVEETEWRIVLHETTIRGKPHHSKKINIVPKDKVICGIPQKIYELNFDIDQHLDYIIIGPTPFYKTVKNSFLLLLTQNNSEIEELQKEYEKTQKQRKEFGEALLNWGKDKTDNRNLDKLFSQFTDANRKYLEEFEKIMNKSKEICSKIKRSDISLR